jgi:dolichol-phosphate mannosyltransferase
LVIPSRFIDGGSDGGLNWQRKIVSWTARTLARIALKKARPVSDCTGGFFGLHRNVVEGKSLNPIGWKILLEIIVKGSYKSFEEIPYAFHARRANLSKMNFKEQYNYIKHIVALVASSPSDRRFILFCAIGALGMLVNMLFFSILMYLSNNQAIISSITASSLAMVHNYIWNDLVTWKDIKNYRHTGRFSRFVRFCIVCSVGILITALVVKIFTTLNWNPYLGQFTGILAAVTWNFF